MQTNFNVGDVVHAVNTVHSMVVIEPLPVVYRVENVHTYAIRDEYVKVSGILNITVVNGGLISTRFRPVQRVTDQSQ
jgi:hypothetical protein